MTFQNCSYGAVLLLLGLCSVDVDHEERRLHHVSGGDTAQVK